MSYFTKESKKLLVEGIGTVTVPAGSIGYIEWDVPVDIYLTGIDYEAVANYGDTATFEILVGDTVVNCFGKDVYVRDYMKYEFYAARIPVGCTIRITYNNNGVNDSIFNCNLIKHIDG